VCQLLEEPIQTVANGGLTRIEATFTVASIHCSSKPHVYCYLYRVLLPEGDTILEM
jgi:hypothetical protein